MNLSCIETGKNLIKIISGIINNEKADIPDNADFERILKLSKAHRVTAFAAYGAEQYKMENSIKTQFQNELFKVAARYTAQEREIKELSELFSKEKIEHCFLKGHKISALYDVPESRFMLDIDIFISGNNFCVATEILKNRGYEVVSEDGKDCSLTKKPFLNIDLHRELKYDYDLGYDFYKNVSERLVFLNNENGDSFEKSMTNEEFYTYLLSHTAHHFMSGGTGIKSVIDHYFILKNLVPECNADKLKDYLEKSGLTRFNEQFTALTNAWFSGGEHTEITEKMGEYVILSGAYGTDLNYYVNTILRNNNTESKNSYIFKRLFPSAEAMCYRFPLLKDKKFLLPLFYILRIFIAVFSFGRIKDETKGISNVNEKDKQKQDIFLKNVGL